MTDEPAKASPQLESAQDVDRIREIIFGSQMRDYQQRFQSLQRDLARHQQEIDQLAERLSEQGSDQGKKLQSLRQELRQADEDLRDELRQTGQKLAVEKVDRLVLGELFIELGTHLKTGGSLADWLTGLREKEAE
jgi:predicted  nucleic acid-binding Zn-ribbon protein